MSNKKRSLSVLYGSSEDTDSDCPTQSKRHSRASFNDESSPHNSPTYSITSQESDHGGGLGGIGGKLMAKMGYKSGTGLGKHNQGRVVPVEMSTQRGRRGLGLHLEGLEAADIEWDPSQETVEVREEVKWLVEDAHVPISLAQLRAWMTEGPVKKRLDDETQFCDSDILRNVLSSKSVFDLLDKQELLKARTRSNPFETIGKGIFLNRAAMKMANMDAICDFMFTNPVHMGPEPYISLVEPGKLLYFADVCAGPGGFSEYILWRKKWEAKGFGMTLRDSNDFKLEEFYAGPCESFEPYYGANEDGNVYDPKNIKSLKEFVLNHTSGRGVHFMMADGGFSVDGQENIQEILSKQLYVCQCLIALNIVRTNGHFVVKLFDVFTPFSVGLLYIMYKSFHQIAIHKPNTSRPANSERYLICKWKRDNTSASSDFLFEVNEKLNKSKFSDKDIIELVPTEVMREDKEFFDYIEESNNNLGERQIINLVKIKAFCQDLNLMETRQADMKRECLQFWRVPDKTRTVPRMVSAEEKVACLVNMHRPPWLSSEARMMTPATLNSDVTPYDWRCVVLEGSKERLTYYVGLGRGHVYSWDSNRGKWFKCRDIELSPDTLIYAEVVSEYRGEGRSQVKVSSLHIIDALFLGGTDVRAFHLKQRLEMCQKYTLAINKPTRTELIALRVKELFSVVEMEILFNRLEHRQIKGHGGQVRLGFTLENGEKFYIPSGLLFLKTTRDPWQMAMSRSQHRKYWHNKETKASVFECPKDANLDVVQCFERRLWWPWTQHVNLEANGDISEVPSGTVHRCTIEAHLSYMLNR